MTGVSAFLPEDDNICVERKKEKNASVSRIHIFVAVLLLPDKKELQEENPPCEIENRLKLVELLLLL